MALNWFGSAEGVARGRGFDRWSIAALASAVAIAGGGSAFAQGVDVEVTSTTVVSWHSDNDDDPTDTQNFDDDYGEVLERLNLSVNSGQLQGNLRLDLGTYLSTPTYTTPEPPNGLVDRYDTYVNPEKVWLSYSTRDVEVIAGDSYVSFGRGLVLSMRKIDEFGTDSTVRGAKVLVHNGPITATLIGGYANINNVDEATGREEDDPYDVIAGAQASYRLGKFDVGGRGAAFLFYQPLGFTPPGQEPEHFQDRWFAYGPSVDAPRLTDDLGIYLEAIGQSRNQGSLIESGSGYGVYGAATYHHGSATVVFEGKAYGDLEVVQPDVEHSEFATIQYYNPPTLERVTQIIDHAQQDTVGGRVRGDYSLGPATLLFANYALIRDYVGFQTETADGLETVPATIHDPYGGLELRWDQMRSRLKLLAGWRVAMTDKTSDVVRGDRHAELEVVQRLTDRLSLVISGNHIDRKEVDAPFIDKSWREGVYQVGLQWSPILSVGAVYEYTTDSAEPQTHYFNGVVEWRPHELALLRIYAGASHGGLRCVSNVCRYFPPFEGVKVTATMRY